MRPPKVKSTYGAPMGRPSSPYLPEGPVQLFRIPLDSGGYDQGGAYWGTPDNLWMADEPESGYRDYFRGKTPEAVIAKIKEAFPDLDIEVELPMDLDAFLQGYLECAAWCGVYDSEGEEDEREFTTDDFTKKAVAQARRECKAFLEANIQFMAKVNMSQAGHDFWLTRNGHGAGFWDRPNIYGGKENAEKLSEAARRERGRDVMVSRVGKLNFA